MTNPRDRIVEVTAGASLFGEARRAAAPEDAEVAEVCRRHGNGADGLLPVLRELQARRHGLTRGTIESVAVALGMPASHVASVATFYALLDTPGRRPPVLRVCDGPACWLQGAPEVLRTATARLGTAAVRPASCLGLCDRAPAALLHDRAIGAVTPPAFDTAAAHTGPSPVYAEPRADEIRVLLAGAGMGDPESLEAARRRGAWDALETVVAREPEWTIACVEAAGLLGRGGAGFPAARKWRLARDAGPAPRYLVCNADESEPMAFKDRVLMDADPHQLLEGIAIAAYAVGAAEAIVYVRGEYEAQARRLERALAEARSGGALGALDVHVHRGAGAYICGEETALLESLEGRRGEPRLRPPFPVSAGYRGRPTVVHNVETLAAIPAIVRHGAEWFRRLSPHGSPGTKLYTIVGHVARPGLVEAPHGLTLRRLVEELGGGMRAGASFGFALVGGAAGVVVPPAGLDEALDFGRDRWPIGSGAILVCDRSVSIAALLGEVMRFFERESCGKCTPCRIGTRRARERLEGRPVRASLRELARTLAQTSFCGLGQSAAMPLASALDHFPETFGAERDG